MFSLFSLRTYPGTFVSTELGEHLHATNTLYYFVIHDKEIADFQEKVRPIEELHPTQVGLIFPLQTVLVIALYMYSRARIIRTQNTRKICVNYPYIEVNGEAYNCVNNDSVNYQGCANKRGSNYPGYTVNTLCTI